METCVHACKYKIHTAQVTAGTCTRGRAVCCSISFLNPCLHVYLCAKSLLFINQVGRACSVPTTKPRGPGSRSSLWSPRFTPRWLLTVHHVHLTADTRLPTLSSSWEGPSLSPFCSLPFALLHGPISAQVLESGALICRCVRRKGQDLKQNGLAEKQPVGSCWSDYTPQWRTLFLFSVQSTRELRASLWSREDEFMPQCLGKLENCALQFIYTFPKPSGKRLIILLSLAFQGTALLHAFLFAPKTSSLLIVWAPGACTPLVKCLLCQASPGSLDGAVARSHHLFIFAVVQFPSLFQDFSAVTCTHIRVFCFSRCFSVQANNSL